MRRFTAFAAAISLMCVLAADTASARRWSRPVQVDVDRTHAPAVRVDALGNATSIWLRGDLNPQVYGAFGPFDGQWRSATPISSAAGVPFPPSFAVNARGDAVAGWSRIVRMYGCARNFCSFSDNVVEVAIRPAGRPWQAPVALSRPEESTGAPTVGIDGRGKATAVWTRGDESTTETLAADRPPGGSWQPPVRVPIQHPAGLYVNERGDALAAWCELYTCNASWRPVGRSWQAPRVLFAISPRARSEMGGLWVAMRPRGGAVALASWREGVDNGEYISYVAANVMSPDGAWGRARVMAGPEYMATGAGLGVDARGTATAAWVVTKKSESGDAPTRPAVMESSTLRVGGRWTPPVRLPPAGDDTIAASLSVSAAGDAALVWRHQYPGNGPTYVRAAVRAPGGAWSRAVNLSEAEGQPVPDVAMDHHGGAVAIWQTSTGGGARSSRLPPREPAVGLLSASGRRVSYVVNMAARVRFTLRRVRRGRLVPVRGALTRRRPPGGDRFTLPRRFAGHRLSAGRYRLAVKPFAGRVSGRTRYVRLRIPR